jgi:hypothetical protein
MAHINFDASAVAPTKTYDAVVPGEYTAMITESEMRATSAGTGEYLALTFQIIGGDFDQRKLWVNLNLKNPSQQTVEFAQRDLSAICHATGVLHPQDTEELHDIPMSISVAYEIDKLSKQPKLDSYGKPKNTVRGYKKAGSQVAAPVTSANSPAPAQAPAAPSSAKATPWAKKAA